MYEQPHRNHIYSVVEWAYETMNIKQIWCYEASVTTLSSHLLYTPTPHRGYMESRFMLRDGFIKMTFIDSGLHVKRIKLNGWILLEDLITQYDKEHQ